MVIKAGWCWWRDNKKNPNIHHYTHTPHYCYTHTHYYYTHTPI